MNNELFARLFPVKVNFITGESPSPSKLNGIFSYLNSAFFVLESFLGNGLDYRTTELEGRKMMFNVSSAIGQMSNLYKPINKLTSLEHIYKHYIALHSETGASFTDNLHLQHGSYSYGDGMISEKLVITLPVNIPLDTRIQDSHYLKIAYKGTATLKLRSDSSFIIDSILANITDTLTVYSVLINPNTFLNYISLIPTGDGIEIFSISLVSAVDGSESRNNIYNTSHAMPLDNGQDGEEGFWKIAKPCEYAKASSLTICQHKTCDMCIGNTYDIFSSDIEVKKGEPICGGLYSTSVSSLMISKDQNGNTISYSPVIVPDGEITKYVFQSCIMLKSKPYMVKYASFAAHNNLPAGTTLEQNSSVIYDIAASFNPVKYDIALSSAGRSDIVYVSDIKSELMPGGGVGLGLNKYMVIGGQISITSMLSDILKNISQNDTPKTAVFAD